MDRRTSGAGAGAPDRVLTCADRADKPAEGEENRGGRERGEAPRWAPWCWLPVRRWWAGRGELDRRCIVNGQRP